jgi:biotin carboxylase
MDDQYIYIVGKPDPQSESREAIHRLGYKTGLLLDSRASTKHPELYERVISIDFSSIDTEIARLETLDLKMAGLLCTYENYIVAKAKIGEHFAVPTPSLLSAQRSTDKSLMRQAFIDADPAITPNFTAVNSLAEALIFAEAKGYPLMLKPTNLVKSLLVLRCNDKKELIENYEYASNTIQGLYEKYDIYDREPQLIIEECIIGKTCSIAAFVDNNGTPHFCEGIASLTSAQEIKVSDNYLYSRHLPATFNDDLTKKLFDVAEKGIRALEMRAIPAHVELIYNENEVKLIEIGARIGGYRPRMYEYSYGLDLIDQELRLAVGQQPQLRGSFKAFSAVYELFPEHEGAFAGVDGVVDTSLYHYYAVKARTDQLIGPAKNGYKAAVIIIVVEQDEQRFNEICKTIDNLRVRVA